MSDEQLRDFEAGLRGRLRELGSAEKALEAFTAQHPDVPASPASAAVSPPAESDEPARALEPRSRDVAALCLGS